MLDPLLLACVLAVLAGIIAIVFYLFSGNDDERDFERAFGENARKLFHHDREKHKSKVKLGKKKEVKERKNEPKLDAVIETETAATYEQSSELIDAVASSTATSVKTTAINSNDKKQISKDEKDQIAEFNNDEANMKSIFILGNEVNLPRETSIDENKENQNEQTSYCEGRKRKRNKGRKDEDDTNNDLFPSEKESIGEPSATSDNKLEKERKLKKKVAVVNINDLDSNKVLTRIASLEEIEPEYISFLATYFHDTNAKVHRLEETMNCFEKNEVELKKKIEQYQQSRTITDRQIAEHVRVISELTSKVQSLSVAEAAAKQQIIQLNNIRMENDTLKCALSKSAAEAAAASKALSNLEAVKSSNSELSDRLAKATRSLNESAEQNAALKRELTEYAKQTVALENLQLEFAKLDSVARKLKSELEEKARTIEEVTKMAADSDSRKKVENERDDVIHQFAQARCEWEKKEAALMNEYTSLKNLVDELNKEVAKFEQFKKEQDELEQKLLAREAELAEKSARLAAAENEKQVLVIRGNDRSAELEAENVALRKKLDELENELLEARSCRERSVETAVEWTSENEGIVACQKCPPQLTNAFSACDEGIGLRDENRRLQEKNEELRRRNFKILDHVSELEKQLAATISSNPVDDLFRTQLLDERKFVASTIGSIVNSPLNDSNYNDYIVDLANSLKLALMDGERHNIEDEKTSAAKLQADIENYRGALNSLAALLTQIELGVQERESFYKDKILQLENELNKANGVIASANRLRKELRECESLKKQIQNLRACLGQKYDRKAIAPVKSFPVRSDESDWEVISR